MVIRRRLYRHRISSRSTMWSRGPRLIPVNSTTGRSASAPPGTRALWMGVLSGAYDSEEPGHANDYDPSVSISRSQCSRFMALMRMAMLLFVVSSSGVGHGGAPFDTRPIPASLAGGAGARPDHSISGNAGQAANNRSIAAALSNRRWS